MTFHPDIPAEYRNQIVTGDARKLAECIPDESVDLIFTDPVYNRIEDYEWLAETAARVLRPDSACLAFFGIGYLDDTLQALKHGLTYRWQGLWYQSNRIGSHADMGFCLYSPFFWMEKGRSKRIKQTQDVANVPFTSGTNGKFHNWNKQPAVIMKYLDAFLIDGGIVLDPFTGGGVVPAVCKILNRNYIAFEIDPATAEMARERVLNTQPPLFVPEPEQLELRNT